MAKTIRKINFKRNKNKAAKKGKNNNIKINFTMEDNYYPKNETFQKINYVFKLKNESKLGNNLQHKNKRNKQIKRNECEKEILGIKREIIDEKEKFENKKLIKKVRSGTPKFGIFVHKLDINNNILKLKKEINFV